MLLIKFTAADLKLIKAAVSEPEQAGVVSLVRDRISQAEVLRSFGKTVQPDKVRYSIGDALKKCKEVLGENAVTTPPYPDNSWYARINGVLRVNGFNDEYVTKICEFVKANMMGKRASVSFDFMMCQHRRILDGDFVDKSVKATPRLNEHQLPEE